MKNLKLFYSVEIFGANNLSSKDIQVIFKRTKMHRLHRVFVKNDAIFFWVSPIRKQFSLDSIDRYEYTLMEAIETLEVNKIKMKIQPYHSNKMRPLWLLMSDSELKTYGEKGLNF